MRLTIFLLILFSTIRLEANTYQLGKFTIEADKKSGSIVVKREQHDMLSISEGEHILSVQHVQWHSAEDGGAFKISEKLIAQFDQQAIKHVDMNRKQLRVTGMLTSTDEQLTQSCYYTFELAFHEGDSEDNLAIDSHVTPHDCSLNAKNEKIKLGLHFNSNSQEHFFGFGEQFTYIDLKGQHIPIITQEQGVGRGHEPLTSLINASSNDFAGGNAFTTYSAIPQFITNMHRGFYLENTELSDFDLSKDDKVSVNVLSQDMHAHLIYGNTPLDLIEQYTLYSGRMNIMPDWVGQGAIVGTQNKTALGYKDGIDWLEHLHEQLQAFDTPIAAFWIQDWVGKRRTSFGSQLWWNWERDEEIYPEVKWREFLSKLRKNNIRMMGYINPFLADVKSSGKTARRYLYSEARDQNLFVKNREGKPYIHTIGAEASLLDLSQEKTKMWLKDVIKNQLISEGFSGWMADFSEALPFDAVLSAGSSPFTYHNKYPEIWAKINQEAISESGKSHDIVYFMRAMSTRSPGNTSLFWLGDQTVTWDGDDGLASAIKGLISGGFSGLSLNHSDIGGYTSFKQLNLKRSEELLLRWMEFGAYTAVYRTHEGNQPAINSQIFSNHRLLSHFAKFAKVYRDLSSYRKQLMQEAAQKGYPLVRHLMLQFPDDVNVYRQDYQYEFMLGSKLLVAPVIQPDCQEMKVYLPKGIWQHQWSDQVYQFKNKGQVISISCELGKPPVFWRKA